ncbi:MAG: hypothetical protein LBQ88_14025 [Treponema sp.]|jgi:hypothetical protein|nr:hypothetical protein [Treponema sp.]
MNIFDFLYKCIKLIPSVEIPILIFFGFFSTAVLLILCKVSKRIKEITFGKNTLKMNKSAEEKRQPRDKRPAVLQDISKTKKEIWNFSGAAFYLGKGRDNRHYFIGHFGTGIPSGYKCIMADCETIIGTDWDNTPEWDQAFERAKELYGFSVAEDVPSYQGNGSRLNRKLHGVYATWSDIS